MTTSPLVTVIVPVYNVEKFLPACLNSIIGQTYKNLQIILVEDGSSDCSLAVVEDFEKRDSRIEKIVIENHGQAYSRNVALDRMRGQYVMFCDSDDYMDLDAIEFLLKLIESHDADLSCAGFYNVYANSVVDGVGYPDRVVNRMALIEMYLKYNNLISSPCGRLFKSTLFDEVRFPYGKIFEDRYASLEVFEKCNKAVFSERRLYYYLQRKGSTVHRAFSTPKLFYVDIARRDEAFVKSNYPELQSSVVNVVSEAIVEVLKWILNGGYRQNKIYFNDLLLQLKKEYCAKSSDPLYDKKSFFGFAQCPLLTGFYWRLRFFVGRFLRKAGLRNAFYRLID